LENTRCSAGWRWLAVGLYAALLFYLSSRHHPAVPRFLFSDKLLHLLFYAGFGAVVAWAFDAYRRGWSWRKVVLASAAGAFLYGATDEIHQLFVSERTADFVDLICDVAGGALGGFFYSVIAYAGRFRRKGKTQGNDSAAASL
jgi:VanZ family protein